MKGSNVNQHISLCKSEVLERGAQELSALKTPAVSRISVAAASEKSDILVQSLGFIREYRNYPFVIKYGGSTIRADDPRAHFDLAMNALALETVQIQVVIVHGGGNAISAALRQEGLKSVRSFGHRITPPEHIPVVDRVLSDIGRSIADQIDGIGGLSKQLSGHQIFRCKKKELSGAAGEPIDCGRVGEIVAVDLEKLIPLLERGVIPVISSTARGEDGFIYNCNADLAAAELAVALEARRLVFMSDIAGVLRDPVDPETLCSNLTLPEVEQMIADGSISGEMLPKIAAALRAVDVVGKVTILDGRIKNAVLLEAYTSEGVGTLIRRQGS